VALEELRGGDRVRTAKPGQLNVIAVTTVEPATPWAAAHAALQAAIDRRRKW
jgi:hypothetical protein